MTSTGSQAVRARRRAHALAAAAAALLLAGCAQVDQRSADEDAPQRLDRGVQQDRAAPGNAADPIARTAIARGIGSTARVAVDGSEVWVTVGEYYDSAAGNRCRRVTLRAPDGGTRVSAVCQRDGQWRTVIRP